MPGDVHTLETARLILEANQLTYRCGSILSKDITGCYDVYFNYYSVGDKIDFLYDAVEYFLFKKSCVINRRVAYVIQSGLEVSAVVFEFSNVNEALVHALAEHIKCTPTMKDAKAIATSNIWENFTQLYRDIKVSVLASGVINDFLSELLRKVIW